MPPKRKAKAPEEECCCCVGAFHTKVNMETLATYTERQLRNRLHKTSVVIEFTAEESSCWCLECFAADMFEKRVLHLPINAAWPFADREFCYRFLRAAGDSSVSYTAARAKEFANSGNGLAARYQQHAAAIRDSVEALDTWFPRAYNVAWNENTVRCPCHGSLAVSAGRRNFFKFVEGPASEDHRFLCRQCLTPVGDLTRARAEHVCTPHRQVNVYYRPRVVKALPATYRPPRNFQITDKMAREFFEDICEDTCGYVRCLYCLTPAWRTQDCKNVHCVCGKPICFNCGSAEGGYACFPDCFSAQDSSLWVGGKQQAFCGHKCNAICQSHDKDCDLPEHADWRAAVAACRRATKAFCFVKSLEHRPHLYRRLRAMYLAKKELVDVRPPPSAFI